MRLAVLLAVALAGETPVAPRDPTCEGGSIEACLARITQLEATLRAEQIQCRDDLVAFRFDRDVQQTRAEERDKAITLIREVCTSTPAVPVCPPCEKGGGMPGWVFGVTHTAAAVAGVFVGSQMCGGSVAVVK